MYVCYGQIHISVSNVYVRTCILVQCSNKDIIYARAMSLERFAGLNLCGFCGFQDYHKSFSGNISTSR